VSITKLAVFAMIACLLFPASSVYGHGFGIDKISSIDVQGKELSISVEMPMYFENDQEQITITVIDKKEKENAKNVTLLIGLFHENEMIFRNYFFAEDGILSIKVMPTQEGKVTIHGKQDSFLGAWHGTESNPIEITGPLFNSSGLYNFEIEVRTVDEPTNIIEGADTYYANLSIAEIISYPQEDEENNIVEFRLKSYFDKISNLEYDFEAKQVTFEMPFDWSEKQMSHVSVVHVEVHFPKDFAEFLSPSYLGIANGIELFKSSVTIDDYTEDDERIVHFVLLKDHLRFLKNEMKGSDEPLPDNIAFTLQTDDELELPLIAYTKSEDFKLNLAWDPVMIEPNTSTMFIFTIRDGMTDEPLRNSDYTFVIIQNGKEIHRTSGVAQIGGHFERFTFAEDQTGPTIVKFENIRNTGQETEFGLVVAPGSKVLTKVQQVSEIVDESENGGGCLIATATFGSEMSTQVQQLREIRDNTLLQTQSGTSFMGMFNDVYYSFSPIIADYERENPLFKEVVKLFITPMISSLSILNYVEMDSESSVLGYGISLILLNIGMYLGVPVVIVIGIRKKF
jgi:hypothetical protein